MSGITQVAAELIMVRKNHRVNIVRRKETTPVLFKRLPACRRLWGTVRPTPPLLYNHRKSKTATNCAFNGAPIAGWRKRLPYGE